MAGEPKITPENVRLRLNGTLTGSTYYFWEQTIESGSLWDIISGASTDIRFMLGNTVMDSTDTNTSREVQEAETVYSCYKTLVNLAGGVIIDGFNWSAGVKVDVSPQMLETFRILIEDFKRTAETKIRHLQDVVVIADADQPSYAQTSVSVM